MKNKKKQKAESIDLVKRLAQAEIDIYKLRILIKFNAIKETAESLKPNHKIQKSPSFKYFKKILKKVDLLEKKEEQRHEELDLCDCNSLFEMKKTLVDGVEKLGDKFGLKNPFVDMLNIIENKKDDDENKKAKDDYERD